MKANKKIIAAIAVIASIAVPAFAMSFSHVVTYMGSVVLDQNIAGTGGSLSTSGLPTDDGFTMSTETLKAQPNFRMPLNPSKATTYAGDVVYSFTGKADGVWVNGAFLGKVSSCSVLTVDAATCSGTGKVTELVGNQVFIKSFVPFTFTADSGTQLASISSSALSVSDISLNVYGVTESTSLSS